MLRIENLTKVFGGLTAVDNVSFEVKAGEMVGLIGPNGAGKTTLFHCISGFYKPTRGQVWFDGQNITGQSPDVICHLGLSRTFQIVRTFPELTVLENVMVGAFAHTSSRKQAESEARRVLELTGLTPKATVLGKNLTIAEKKRLELARALATRPKLLMLDEVMAGLNPAEQQAAVELVRTLHAQGITILMIEHVMEVLMPLSQRVIVLNYGRKIREGVPEQVVRDEDVIAAYLGEKFRRYASGH